MLNLIGLLIVFVMTTQTIRNVTLMAEIVVILPLINNSAKDACVLQKVKILFVATKRYLHYFIRLVEAKLHALKL